MHGPSLFLCVNIHFSLYKSMRSANHIPGLLAGFAVLAQIILLQAEEGTVREGLGLGRTYVDAGAAADADGIINLLGVVAVDRLHRTAVRTDHAVEAGVTGLNPEGELAHFRESVGIGSGKVQGLSGIGDKKTKPFPELAGKLADNLHVLIVGTALPQVSQVGVLTDEGTGGNRDETIAEEVRVELHQDIAELDVSVGPYQDYGSVQSFKTGQSFPHRGRYPASVGRHADNQQFIFMETVFFLPAVPGSQINLAYWVVVKNRAYSGDHFSGGAAGAEAGTGNLNQIQKKTPS